MNIMRMAREADCIDFRDDPHDPHVKQMVEFLERFAALVLEDAAKVCEEKHANGNWKHDTRHECAAAIRALKGAKE